MVAASIVSEPVDASPMNGSRGRSDGGDRRSRATRSTSEAVSRWARLGLTLASALLLTVAQAPIGAGLVAVFALVPWLVATRHADPAEATLLGLILGLAYGLSACPWLPDAFASQGAHGWRSVLGALLTVLWAKGLVYAATGGLAHALRRRPATLGVVGLSTAFGLAQLWTSTSRWGLPVVLLGHSQIAVPGVAQLAVVGGVPLVSALLVATNAGLARAIDDRPGGLPIASGCMAAWLALAAFGLPLSKGGAPGTSGAPHSLLLVQPTVDRGLRWKPAFQRVVLDEVMDQTARALADMPRRPDAILWPENLLTTPLTRDPALRQRLERAVDAWRVPVVTGLVRVARGTEPRRYRSSIVWWRPGQGAIASIDKVRAVPLVESSRDFPGRGLLSGLIGEAARGPLAVEAEHAGPLTGDFTLTPTLCFEVLFPALVAARRSLDAVAIVNLADDSWVEGEVADRQLIAAAAFRAIEERLPLVRVSHGGLSVAVDAYGRETLRLAANAPAHGIVSVASRPRPTPFERASILALAAGPGLLVFLVARRRSSRSVAACASRQASDVAQPRRRRAASRVACRDRRRCGGRKDQ
jgi:apolipoprotein N-acyltransferase